MKVMGPREIERQADELIRMAVRASRRHPGENVFIGLDASRGLFEPQVRMSLDDESFEPLPVYFIDGVGYEMLIS